MRLDKGGTPRAPIVCEILGRLNPTQLIYCLLDFNPNSVIFSPNHYWQVIVSDLGIIIWLSAIAYSISQWGLSTVFRLYLVPYLW